MKSGPIGDVYRVVLVRDEEGPIAVPGKVAARTGDVIVFRSVNVGKVVLEFPRDILTDLGHKRVVKVAIPGNGAEVALRVAPGGTAKPGLYGYNARCGAKGKPAEGGSQPKIIIFQ